MTKEIIKALGKRQVLRNHTPVCANVSCIYAWEVDLFSVNSNGYCYEFEVKISRQDFLKDKKKKKWAMLEWKKKIHIPNYMSYVCPAGLIQPNELPEFAGLYYYSNGEILMIKEPVLKHSEKLDRKEINTKIARLHSQREFLGCSLLTYENAEIRKRNEQRLIESRKGQEELMRRWQEKKLNSEQSDEVCDATKV